MGLVKSMQMDPNDFDTGRGSFDTDETRIFARLAQEGHPIPPPLLSYAVDATLAATPGRSFTERVRESAGVVRRPHVVLVQFVISLKSSIVMERELYWRLRAFGCATPSIHPIPSHPGCFFFVCDKYGMICRCVFLCRLGGSARRIQAVLLWLKPPGVLRPHAMGGFRCIPLFRRFESAFCLLDQAFF